MLIHGFISEILDTVDNHGLKNFIKVNFDFL